jgi:hypothetical protein
MATPPTTPSPSLTVEAIVAELKIVLAFDHGGGSPRLERVALFPRTN